MAVNLSPVGGVAAQFFTNTGAVLTGGKLFTYLAGTTTPATTFTSSNGATPWPNPIVLDAAGRVSGSGEIWLTDGINYKFLLKDSNDVLIATYDNISGINSNFVAYTNQQQIVTATAGQTVFNLSISFQPGTNSLSVFVDGVNQYGPGAQYAYTETDSDTVTFVSGLHVGAEVKFTTSQLQGGGAVDASQVSYIPAGVGAVATNVQAKLRQTVSAQDFGAIGNGVTDDTTAIQAALSSGAGAVYFPSGTYKITNFLTVPNNVMVYGDGWASLISQVTQDKNVFVAGNDNSFVNLRAKVVDGSNATFNTCIYAESVNNLTVDSCFLELADFGAVGVQIRNVQNSRITNNRIFGGKWDGTTAGNAASAADILLYSSGASERHIIEGNHCLSNNSQGMFIDALGKDGDIVVANNICVTLNPATCTPTGTWALAAFGGVRRHGMLVGYNDNTVYGSRCVVDGNICRNTRWTGIYIPQAVYTSIIVSNNICDLNGYELANSLSGGIFADCTNGQAMICNNTITRFQNTLVNTGGITINATAAASGWGQILGNKITDSLASGIAIGTFSSKLKISENVLQENANSDIYAAVNPVAFYTGEFDISNNICYRVNKDFPSIYLSMQAGVKAIFVKDNVINGIDSTTSNLNNCGIRVGGTVTLINVVGNLITNFYYGYVSNDYFTGRNIGLLLDSNMLINCNTGFNLSATTPDVTVPLVNNTFTNVTTPTAGSAGFDAGRICSRNGGFLEWQTTAIPAAGSWIVGDVARNTVPTVGQPKSWNCTVTGTPGTWVSTGNL
jgi:hypothetical protein